MCPFLDNTALFQHDNLVRVLNRTQTVRDNDNCLFFQKAFQLFLNLPFVIRV